jgi:hypothetical protein
MSRYTAGDMVMKKSSLFAWIYMTTEQRAGQYRLLDEDFENTSGR